LLVIQKVLVTGGTGFIGQHLVNELLAKARQICVLTRNVQGFYNNGRITYYTGDFTRAADLATLLSGVDVVYHLAVTTTPGHSNEQIQYDAHTNLMGSLTLMEQAAKAGVRRFVFVSSGGSVYGLNGGSLIDEEHPTNPISAHGVSKLAAEKYLEIFRRQYGMEYRIARASNPYGEGQDPNRGQGFIAYALGRLSQGEELVIWGDGSVVRDYVYVGDVAEALALMLDDQAPYRVYNVGSGQGHSLNELVAILAQLTGRKSGVRYVAGRPADVPYNCLHIGRIKQALRWEPHTDLQTGLALTWEWVCQTMAPTPESEAHVV
jgi:UDP-glucose 4-epimerase